MEQEATLKRRRIAQVLLEAQGQLLERPLRPDTCERALARLSVAWLEAIEHAPEMVEDLEAVMRIFEGSLSGRPGRE